MKDEEQTLKEYIKEEKLQKTFAKVFDRQTIMTVHKIAKKGYFDILEFVVSTGKEAHVFRASDKAGNPRAVKIYKTKTSDFKNMEKYIKGDQRFKEERKTKQDIVFAWAKKEFKNLSLARSAQASVPLPIFVLENVLVMEFIGAKDAEKTLKEIKSTQSELQDYYEQTIDFMAKIFLKKELVHADLSEYNIMVRAAEKKLVFIDMGQGVLASHPYAQEFFERDIQNMTKFFSKHGIETSTQEMLARIKEKKSIYTKE